MTPPVSDDDTEYRYVCPNCEWAQHEDDANLATRASRQCPQCNGFLGINPVEGIK